MLDGSDERIINSYLCGIWRIIMGTLDQPTGSVTVRKLKFVDVTGYSTDQIENAFNNNYGKIGWRIVQVFEKGTKTLLMAEKEESA